MSPKPRARRASSLVHISAIGADPKAQSAYGRTKGEGEAAVRAAFQARRSPAVDPLRTRGPFRQSLCRNARISPDASRARARPEFQPVYVERRAQALAVAALDRRPWRQDLRTWRAGDSDDGRTAAWIAARSAASRRSSRYRIGRRADARFGWTPGAPITRDQWLMLQQDNVVAVGARLRSVRRLADAD